MMSKKGLAWAVIGLLVLSLSRFLPHPPNFTPILSAGILTGAFLPRKIHMAFLPLAAMFVTDLVLGLHDTLAFVYGGVFASYLVGSYFLEQKKTHLAFVGASFASSFVFFVISNFGVWAVGSLDYPKTIRGLMACYTAGIPFFGNTLTSTTLFAVLGKVAWETLESHRPEIYDGSLR
jgi:hypothetical protein